MDLGLAGRTALVCGGSKGLGRAAALALFSGCRFVDRLDNAEIMLSVLQIIFRRDAISA